MLLPYQQQLLKSLQRHSDAYRGASFLLEEIGQHLLARLAYFRYPPQMICDLGCGQGMDSKLLAQCYSGAEIIGVDFSEAQIKRAPKKDERLTFCVAEAQSLPLPSKYFDLVFANLLLPAIMDYHSLWREALRILKPGGIFLFSSLGPETLRELKACFETLEHPEAINQFPDMHDIGDSLIQAGFQDSAIDTEKFALHYSTLKKFLEELKALGSIKIWDAYPSLSIAKNFWQAVEEKYRLLFPTENLKLPVTVEAYYAIAFAPSISSLREIPITLLKRKTR